MKKTPEKLQKTPTLTNIKIKKERTKTTKTQRRRKNKDDEQHSSAELGRNSSGAVPEVGQNTSSYETGRMVSDACEGNCDVSNDEVTLRIIMYVFLFAELSLVVLYQFY